MEKSEILNGKIETLHEMLSSGSILVSEVVNTYIENAKEKNSDINAVLEFFNVEEEISKAQEMFKAGTATKLTGIPYIIKDNILVEGKISSASSKVLENYVAPYSATVVKKLQEAGAICIGRANMDEFAMGGSTENSAFGVTKNPHDLSKVAGGSSGGSAASVAMLGAVFALGSDTGGSIRQPASFCGVVGLKPTYGSVSRHGLMAMASSLDVIGPITKNTQDAEIVFDVIRGKDPLDSTSIDIESAKINNESLESSEKIKIGVPRHLLSEGIDAEVLEDFNNSIEKLRSKGYEIVDVQLPNLKYSLATYYVIMPAEVSSNMSRYDGIRYGKRIEGDDLIGDYFSTRGELLGREVRRRIMLGTYVLSTGYYDAYYGTARIARAKIRRDFENAFKEVSAIAIPTSPMPAFGIGEKSNDPLSMYLADILTVPANLAGIPAISIPSGKTKDQLPLGLQLLSAPLKENILFEVGRNFEIM